MYDRPVHHWTARDTVRVLRKLDVATLETDLLVILLELFSRQISEIFRALLEKYFPTSGFLVLIGNTLVRMIQDLISTVGTYLFSSAEDFKIWLRRSIFGS